MIRYLLDLTIKPIQPVPCMLPSGDIQPPRDNPVSFVQVMKSSTKAATDHLQSIGAIINLSRWRLSIPGLRLTQDHICFRRTEPWLNRYYSTSTWCQEALACLAGGCTAVDAITSPSIWPWKRSGTKIMYFIFYRIITRYIAITVPLTLTITVVSDSLLLVSIADGELRHEKAS